MSRYKLYAQPKFQLQMNLIATTQVNIIQPRVVLLSIKQKQNQKHHTTPITFKATFEVDIQYSAQFSLFIPYMQYYHLDCSTRDTVFKYKLHVLVKSCKRNSLNCQKLEGLHSAAVCCKAEVTGYSENVCNPGIVPAYPVLRS